jgi:hypothetical protein
MDLAKLIGLLDSRRLHLTRLDRMEDPLEGALRRPAVSDPAAPAVRHQTRPTIFVSSWYLGEHESEAMWRIYCPGGQGVALRTSYARLAQTAAANADTYVGLVRYIDDESQPLPPADPLASIMHKRIAFAHEREARLFAMLPDARAGRAAGPAGLEIDWDLAAMIEHVYVDPYAEEYFAQAVKTVVRRMAPSLDARLVWSRMRVAPLFPSVETPLGVRAILAAARNSYRVRESVSAAPGEGAASHPSRPRGRLKPRSGGLPKRPRSPPRPGRA